MNLWDEAGELEKISNQLSCLGNVLELLAGKNSNDAESGTLWLCRDVCESLHDRLQLRVESLIAMHVEKKGKK